MDESMLLTLYKQAMDKRKEKLIDALKIRQLIYLRHFGALTEDEFSRIDKLGTAERQALEIIKSVTAKGTLTAYMGLSKSIWKVAEESAKEIFPFLLDDDKWWLRFQHLMLKPCSPPELQENALALLWVMTDVDQRGDTSKALKQAGLVLKETTKLAEWPDCQIFEPDLSTAATGSNRGEGCIPKDEFPNTETGIKQFRLFVVFVNDLFKFFANETLNDLLSVVKPAVVVMTGCCAASDSSIAKAGDTVVVAKTDSTPWFGELEHMTQLWTTRKEVNRVMFSRAGMYYTQDISIISPTAVCFYHVMKNCGHKGIIYFAVMSVQGTPSDVGTSTAYVVQALRYLAYYYDMSKYKYS